MQALQHGLRTPNEGINQRYLKNWADVAKVAVGDFYGTGIEIWAGFGPVRQLLRPVFSCFHEQKKFLKNILDGENIFGIE